MMSGMDAGLLDAARTAEMQALTLTYPEVGATAALMPDGYLVFTRSSVLGSSDFAGLVEALLTWQVQVRAGLQVTASSPRVVRDAVVSMRWKLGRLGVTAPCRVVYIVDEPDRQGFAYGTLPGHPESGEESFVLTRGQDGKVVFTVSAFSRPASLMARLSGPAGRLVQRGITSRYLRAL